MAMTDAELDIFLESLKKAGKQIEVLNDLHKKLSENRDQESQAFKDAKTLMDNMNKATKRGIQARLDEAESLEDATAAVKDNLKANIAATTGMWKLNKETGEMSMSANVLNYDFGSMGDAIKKSKSGLSGMTEALLGAGTVGVALGYLLSEVDNTAESYRTLNASGASTTQSLLDFRIAANQGIMSMEEMTTMMDKAGNAVRQVGIVRMAEMSKGVRGAMMDMGRLGMTTEQLNGMLADYMEVEATRGQFTAMNDKQRESRLAKFAVNVDTMSKATGQARENIMKAFKDLGTDKIFASIMRSWGADASDSLGMFVAGMQGVDKDLGDMIGNMTKDLGVYGSTVFSEGSALFESMAPGMSDIIKGMKEGTISQADAYGKMADMAAGMDPQQLRILAQQGVKGADALLALSVNTDKLREAQDRAAKADQDREAMGSFTKMMNNLEETFGAVGTIFNGLGNIIMTGLSPAFDLLATGIGWISEKIRIGAEIIGDWAAGFKSFVDGLGDAGKTITSLGTAAALATAAFVAFKAKAIVGNFTGGIAGGLTGGGAGKGIAGAIGSKVGGLAKSAASTLTGGLSDKVFNAFGGGGDDKELSAGGGKGVQKITGVVGLSRGTLARMKSMFGSGDGGLFGGDGKGGKGGKGGILSKLMSPLKMVGGMFTKLAAFAAPLVTALGGMASAVAAAAAPFLPLIAAVAAVAGVGWLIYDNWEAIVEYGGKFVDWLSELGGKMWDGIKGVISWYVDIWKTIGTTIWDGITGIFSWIGDAIKNINPLNWFSGDDSGGSFFGGLFGGDDDEKVTANVQDAKSTAIGKNKTTKMGAEAINTERLAPEGGVEDVNLHDVLGELRKITELLEEQNNISFTAGRQSKSALDKIANTGGRFK